MPKAPKLSDAEHKAGQAKIDEGMPEMKIERRFTKAGKVITETQEAPPSATPPIGEKPSPPRDDKKARRAIGAPQEPTN